MKLIQCVALLFVWMPYGRMMVLELAAVSKSYGVNNGGGWGDWHPATNCPDGMKAVGFYLKVQDMQDSGDDTALNGIRLVCADLNSYAQKEIEAYSERWGDWGVKKFCPTPGYLTAFRLKFESALSGSQDDTAANDVHFKCSNTGDVALESTNGGRWGDWGDWSSSCSNGICAIATRVEDMCDGAFDNCDDTALNNMEIYCC